MSLERINVCICTQHESSNENYIFEQFHVLAWNDMYVRWNTEEDNVL